MQNLLTRNELERMNETDAKKIALATLSLNGFNSYICKCFNGTFEELNCNTYYNGKYIDYITYPDYVHNIEGLENYIEYCKKQLETKTFTDEALKSFTDYNDYNNKIDYIWNIMTQKYDCISLYDDRCNEVSTDVYKYKCFMKIWRNKDELLFCKNAYLNLKELYNKRIIEDDKMLYKACVYEFYNHESPIDWDGMTPALNTLGIDYKALAPEKQAIVDKAYKYVCNSTNW